MKMASHHHCLELGVSAVAKTRSCLLGFLTIVSIFTPGTLGNMLLISPILV